MMSKEHQSLMPSGVGESNEIQQSVAEKMSKASYSEFKDSKTSHLFTGNRDLFRSKGLGQF